MSRLNSTPTLRAGIKTDSGNVIYDLPSGVIALGLDADEPQVFVTVSDDLVERGISAGALVAAAVEAETGILPEASTTGGTSDARFLKDLCPVIEFGLSNATMHKRDEAVAIPDLEALARIYARIAAAALAG